MPRSEGRPSAAITSIAGSSVNRRDGLRPKELRDAPTRRSSIRGPLPFASREPNAGNEAMTLDVRFRRNQRGCLTAEYGSDSRRVRDLGDLRSLLELGGRLSPRSIRRLGFAAVLLAVRDLRRGGMEPGLVNLYRACDPYYLVFAEHEHQVVFEGAFEEAADLVRRDPQAFQERIWRELAPEP